MLGVEKEEVHHFMNNGLIRVIRIGGGGGDDATKTTVTATKTSLKKWIRTASNFVALIPYRLIRQMLAKFVEVEY